MGNAKFSDDFKRDAVHPLSGNGLPSNHEKKITVRGYPVSEVSQRLGVPWPTGECAAITDRQHTFAVCVGYAFTPAGFTHGLRTRCAKEQKKTSARPT